VKKGLKIVGVGKEVHQKQSTEPPGVFSHRRRACSSGTFQGQERKDILQAVQKHAKAAACPAITPIREAFLEAEVRVTWGREKGERRRRSGQERPRDWQCGHCGCNDAHPCIRDGHSRRQLETGWGHLSDLRVPLLECQPCRHDVGSHVAMLETDHRLWVDLDQQVRFGSGCGESVRQVQEQGSATGEGRVGLRTLKERITQMEPLAQNAHPGPITEVPPVIPRDGIWVTITSHQENSTPDKRKRQRKQRTGRTMVILVALGLWEDGRRDVLDGQMARSDDHHEWEQLVQRFWERGGTSEQGWHLVVRDGSGG